jgi:hypothetical protein
VKTAAAPEGRINAESQKNLHLGSEAHTLEKWSLIGRLQMPVPRRVKVGVHCAFPWSTNWPGSNRSVVIAPPQIGAALHSAGKVELAVRRLNLRIGAEAGIRDLRRVLREGVADKAGRCVGRVLAEIEGKQVIQPTTSDSQFQPPGTM